MPRLLELEAQGLIPTQRAQAISWESESQGAHSAPPLPFREASTSGGPRQPWGCQLSSLESSISSEAANASATRSLPNPSGGTTRRGPLTSPPCSEMQGYFVVTHLWIRTKTCDIAKPAQEMPRYCPYPGLPDQFTRILDVTLALQGWGWTSGSRHSECMVRFQPAIHSQATTREHRASGSSITVHDLTECKQSSMVQSNSAGQAS